MVTQPPAEFNFPHPCGSRSRAQNTTLKSFLSRKSGFALVWTLSAPVAQRPPALKAGLVPAARFARRGLRPRPALICRRGCLPAPLLVVLNLPSRTRLDERVHIAKWCERGVSNRPLASRDVACGHGRRGSVGGGDPPLPPEGLALSSRTTTPSSPPHSLVREEGLEPSRVSPRDPKSRASASSATLAPEDRRRNRLRVQHSSQGPNAGPAGEVDTRARYAWSVLRQ